MPRNNRPIAVFIARDIFTGETQTIYGIEGLQHLGFTKSTVYKCLRGELKIHKNCTWSRGYHEDISRLHKGSK